MSARYEMILKPRTSFAYGIGRDDERPSAASVKAERKAIDALRQRALNAAELPACETRTLELKRIYRALSERGIVSDMAHVGTQERTVLTWAFRGIKLHAPKSSNVESARRVITVSL
jgi:uncharacterized membrane protein